MTVISVDINRDGMDTVAWLVNNQKVLPVRRVYRFIIKREASILNIPGAILLVFSLKTAGGYAIFVVILNFIQPASLSITFIKNWKAE